MDPFTLAYLAGHSDISITKRYVHPEDETIKAAMTSVWNSNAHRATFTECYIGHFYGIALYINLTRRSGWESARRVLPESIISRRAMLLIGVT